MPRPLDHASQLADRQDKINAALRKSVTAYNQASKVPGADKAGEALLRTAVIYNEKLHVVEILKGDVLVGVQR